MVTLSPPTHGASIGPMQPATWPSWSNQISQIPAPQTGCFVAKYPSTVWQQVKCGTAPSIPLLPSRTLAVGGGGTADYVATSASTLIGSSSGSFQISGLTSETNTGGTGVPQGTDYYSLQIDTNTFTTSTTYTGGKSTPAWEQFAFTNDPVSGGSLFIQYWLVGYYHTYGSCPSTSWTPYEGFSCYESTTAGTVPSETASNLSNLIMKGYANFGPGGNDESVLCITGGSCYAAVITGQYLNLYKYWTGAEFNVFGYGSGSQANFNPGTSITVTNTLTDQSVGGGNVIVPSCRSISYTAETNNLDLGSCSSNSNGQIVFTESNQELGSISSVVSAGVGSVWFVLPDYMAGQGSMTHYSAAKCGGVRVALATDVYAGTYLFGSLKNPQQNEILDTNSAYVTQFSSPCGQPRTAAINPSQPLVTIAGPAANEVVNYYESIEKSSPLYYNFATGCITRRDTGVGVSCNFPSTPTSDVFVMEVFTDQAGRTVYIIYGLNWPGTLAGYEVLVNFVLRNPSGYSKSWYVYKWTDATSGVSANSIPDPGDTYTQIASGP